MLIPDFLSPEDMGHQYLQETIPPWCPDTRDKHQWPAGHFGRSHRSLDSPFGRLEQITQALMGLSPEWPGVRLPENIPHPLLSGLEMPQNIHGREHESGWCYLEPPTSHPGIRVPPHPLPPPPIESEDDVASLDTFSHPRSSEGSW